METGYLTNHYLIAMPALEDPNFAHSVTYICEHSAEGAMGIVINRPSELKLSDIVDQMSLDPPASAELDTRLFLGGPVNPERGFVLHRPATQWDSTMSIDDELAITSSRDVLAAIASGEGPAEHLIALGYAGWGPGQLEEEMLSNSWLTLPADRTIMFETPYEQRWEVAVRALGVDLSRLSDEAGRA